MAKWGEGDPRWIVEERPDATNVNNWHWTEKNASQWSKDKIKELFTDYELEDAVGRVKITEVSKCDGEASANNRKAKLIFFYEWDIRCEWEGLVGGSEDVIKGEIHIPNLSEENDVDEVDVNVSLKTDSDAGYKLKQFLRTKGTESIRKQINSYIVGLKDEFATGMILPKKDDEPSSIKPTKPSVSKTEINQAFKSNGAAEKPSSGKGVKIETGVVKMTESFKCTAIEFYRAMTIKEMVQAFTQGACVLEPEVKGKFELLGGNITGEFVELVPEKKIVQKWRHRTWSEGHHSTVVIDIMQKEDCTDVALVQEGVPTSDLERTHEGWKRYYFESMRRTFGFGSMLI